MKLKTLALLPLLLSAPAWVNAADLETDDKKMSYIMGMQIGQGLKMEGIDLKMEAFSTGITDMMEGKDPQIDEATAKALVQKVQEKKQADMAALAISNQKQADAFLAKNAKEKGVVVTDSGLQYKIIEQGEGQSPTPEDTVVAHYTRKALDLTVLDSSHDKGESLIFPIPGAMPAWKEALPLMKEGSKWQLVIPASLAYGEQGAGKDIGPNEALIFDLELISIEMAGASKIEAHTEAHTD
jgi:FKBP-type peptidyl-prolyl cis-trans isomerase